MYGLGGMGGDDAPPQDKPQDQPQDQPQAGPGPVVLSEAAKQQIAKDAAALWWKSVPASQQAALVFAFLQASKSASKYQDDPRWATLTEASLQQEQAKGDKWVEVIELAQRPGEDLAAVAPRLQSFGTVWLADQAKLAAAKPPADKAPTLLWVAAAVLLGWFLYSRKRGQS